jgi:DNA integrity scanning protein DisA with diadenylate cyclase activity
MTNKKLIQEIESILKELNQDRLEKIKAYAESLFHINDEALDIKEEQAVEILGYNPTSQIDDWEWEAMLKRDKMSQDILKQKESK